MPGATPADAETPGPPPDSPTLALLGHVPALDGLRGLAVVLVVTYHFFGQGVLPGGWLGVDIFFALSGFLITALILDEQRVHGRVDLPRFYARRACRLLPALLLMLGVYVLVLLLWHDQTWIAATPGGDGTGRTVDVRRALGDIGISLAYLANWNVIAGSEAPIPHLWSLAVEEQFYLLWPALMLVMLAATRKSRLLFLAALIAISAALPWFYWNGGAGGSRIYFGTDTRAVGLLAGAFCALVWHRRQALGRSSRSGPLRAWVALVVVLAIAGTAGNTWVKFLVLPTVLGIAVGQVVPQLVERRGLLTQLFSNRGLIWAGKRSYGLYLWHYLWATWTHPLGLWPGVPLGLLGALACTQISWFLVEQPASRFGRRFSKSLTESLSSSQALQLSRDS